MSNRAIGYIFTFALGAAAGVAVSWKILKTRYERITQEEIDSFYASVEQPKDTETKVDEKTEERDEYRDVLNSTGYAGKEITEEEVADVNRPYVITDVEFAAIDETEYDIITLTYYSDGILSDDKDDIIYDIDDIVGENSLERFNEPDENGKPIETIYVVNNEMGTVYEILKDNRAYESVSRKLYRESRLEE